MDEKIKLHIMEPVDGYNCTLTKIKMPMMYADRSLINVYYPKDNRDGSFAVISSSMDTKHVETAQKDKIGKDVLMTNHLNYVHLKETFITNPARPACIWTSVTSHELEGYAHKELKDALQKR